MLKTFTSPSHCLLRSLLILHDLLFVSNSLVTCCLISMSSLLHVLFAECSVPWDYSLITQGDMVSPNRITLISGGIYNSTTLILLKKPLCFSALKTHRRNSPDIWSPVFIAILVLFLQRQKQHCTANAETTPLLLNQTTAGVCLQTQLSRSVNALCNPHRRSLSPHHSACNWNENVCLPACMCADVPFISSWYSQRLADGPALRQFSFWWHIF